MFHRFCFCLCLWRLVGGVHYRYRSEEGTVTLRSGVTELKNDDQIQWRFGNEETLIAEINEQTNRFSVFDDVLDGRFRDRLTLDNETGSLTITDIRTKHAGVYKAQTNNETISIKLKVDTDVKEVSVKMRNSVTLSSGVTDMMNDDQIKWRFESKEIAEVNVTAGRFSVFDDVLGGRFRDRLKLDKKTGSLIITDIRTEHAGDYRIHTNYLYIFFHLYVYDEISVKEEDSVTLNPNLTEMMDYDDIHWRFGYENTVIAKIYNRRIRLYDDVLDGRFSNRLKLDKQTGHLTITNITSEHAGGYKVHYRMRNVLFILTVLDSAYCCGTTEAAIRLVVTALMGVASAAAVVVLVYDIRSRRAEQD
ncbi:uncharacterized protein isoform X2 [Danio rerio]|uniref:Uncharacterized protein isoform X2 n=1 Tax=Danio rerio TaxID=7955 RepID=A0AC58IFW6_DANRE